MLPTRETAERLLHDAERANPGPWVMHSKHVARAAQSLAAHHPDLEPERAYILGLLHDLGRRTGPNQDRHILDGYDALEALGYADAARIALTHSFPVQRIEALQGVWDGTSDELERLRGLLGAVTYTMEDRLFQLCDALALPDGCCVLEERLVDVALRYGVGALTADKWRAYLAIKADFERGLGRSVYSVLPGFLERYG
jgi:hypothetical protein